MSIKIEESNFSQQQPLNNNEAVKTIHIKLPPFVSSIRKFMAVLSKNLNLFPRLPFKPFVPHLGHKDPRQEKRNQEREAARREKKRFDLQLEQRRYETNHSSFSS